MAESIELRPHRASVLGSVLHSLGFDPGYHGPQILGTNAASLARILSGNERTIAGMLDDLSPAVSVAWGRHYWANKGVVSLPFLHLARRIVALEPAKREAAIAMIPTALRSWATRPLADSSDEGIMAARREAVRPFADALGYADAVDLPSLFSALARLAGFSVADIADAMQWTFSEARDVMNRGTEPPAEAYAMVLAEIDEHDRLCNDRTGINVQAGPVCIALAWQRYTDHDDRRMAIEKTKTGGRYVERLAPMEEQD